MDKSELIKFLKDNLTIEVIHETEWDGRKEVVFILKIDGEKISQCSITVSQ